MADEYDRLLEQHGLRYPTEMELDAEYRKLLARELVPEDVIQLGTNPDTGQVLWIKPDQLAYGMHIIGPPGKGKSNASKYIGSQIIDLVERFRRTSEKQAAIFVDPHAELAEHLLDVCVERDVDDKHLVYFDLKDRDWVPVLRVLRPEDYADRIEDGIPLAAYSFVEAVTRALGVELMMQNPLITETMFNAGAALAWNRCSVAELPVFGQNTLENLAIREALLENVGAEGVSGHWREINELPKKDRRIETSSAARRWDFFLRFRALKRILGQTMGGIDFSEIMEEGKIAIFNLGLHRTGITDQCQRFLGSLILHQIKAAAGRRRKNKASPVYLLVDEFQRFANFDIMESLAEMRGFGLRPILVHQRLDQLMMEDQDPRLMRAVLSIPNKLIFGGGLVDDQLTLARQAWGPWVNLQKRKLEIRNRSFRPLLRKVHLRSSSVSTGASEFEGESSMDSESWGTSSGAGLGMGAGAGTVTPPGGGQLFGVDPTVTEHTQQSQSSFSGETAGSGTARGRSSGKGTHRMSSEGVTESYVTDHEEFSQLTNVQFETAEDQLFVRMQENIRRGVGTDLFMKGQEEPPQAMTVPYQEERPLRPSAVEAKLERMGRAQPESFMPVAKADLQIETRKRKLLEAGQPQIENATWGGSKKKTPRKRS